MLDAVQIMLINDKLQLPTTFNFIIIMMAGTCQYYGLKELLRLLNVYVQIYTRMKTKNLY
jgi:hypothetical protein